MPLDIVCPNPPETNWSACVLIPGVQGAQFAPERQDWAHDTPSTSAVCLVVLPVAGRRGPVLFANGMRVSRIAQRRHISRAHLRAEHSCGRAPTVERIINEGLRCCRQKALR